MNTSTGVLRRIDVISALLFVIAVATYFWPVTVGKGVDAPAATRAVAVAPALTADAADVQAVIAANLLSASRRAPARRYTSPDDAATAPFELPPAFAPAVSMTSDSGNSGDADSEESVPALYGIVSVGGSTKALLRLSAADVNPSLFGEGEKRGAYRVISIRAGSVVLAGPSGPRTLRLARTARGDSIGQTP